MSSKERDLCQREASLSSTEQRVANLTRRLETDLHLLPSTSKASLGARASLEGFGSAIGGGGSTVANSTATTPGPCGAFGGRQQSAAALPATTHSSSSSGRVGPPRQDPLPTSSSFSTPAGSPHPRQPNFDTAAQSEMGSSGGRGQPQHTALKQMLSQLQAATSKGANR